MNRKLLYPILALALAVAACNLPGRVQVPTPTTGGATLPPVQVPTNTALVPLQPTATNTTGPATPTTTTAPLPQPTAGEGLDVLKNLTYHAPYLDRTVKLTDGTYTDSSGGYNYIVTMQPAYAFGDMNGDTNEDAAVILSESSGGSGTFISLIILINKDGQFKQTGETMLGDRVLVKTIEIYSGVAHLDMLTHGPNDGLCCPSLPEKQNYWLFGNLVFLMRVTTTPTNTERIVAINSPGHWSTQTNPFDVNGSVTVLPFENTLGYKIYTIDGHVVNEGSVTVTPTGGTAGVFTKTFNLSNAGITDWVIIQFYDTSAADGSIIALGSVILRAH